METKEKTVCPKCGRPVKDGTLMSISSEGRSTGQFCDKCLRDVAKSVGKKTRRGPMDFDGVINKITVTSKKDGDFEQDYLQLLVLVQMHRGDDLSHFAGFFRQAARFTVEKHQGDMNL